MLILHIYVRSSAIKGYLFIYYTAKVLNKVQFTELTTLYLSIFFLGASSMTSFLSTISLFRNRRLEHYKYKTAQATPTKAAKLQPQYIIW